MDIASETERIVRLKEVVPTKQGLLEAGFLEDLSTGLMRWDCCGVRVDAGEDWMIGWRCMATAVTRRTALCDEFRLAPQMPRGELLARLLKCWRGVFEKGPVPDALRDGLFWEQFQHDMRRIRERASMLVHADTPFLSLVIRRIKETAGDREIAFSYLPGQLVVNWDGTEYHVPARGHWLGTCKSQASTFVKALPRRLPARSTPIAYARGTLLLAYCNVPASWAEA